jgi:hypothetical protein
MNTRNSMHALRKATASALLAALLLVGCGGEKPEAMLVLGEGISGRRTTTRRPPSS